LKDLVQILASARLGVKGMGIVNQGAGDVFLRANSLERREMIEEMIGLKEVRLKKDEADRKIKETKNNLLQTQAIILEIEPGLRSLKRQLNRWQSRKQKQEELFSLEKEYFIEKLSELSLLVKESGESDLKSFEKLILALKQEIQAREEELKNLQEQDPQLLQKQLKQEKDLDLLQRQKAETLRVLGNIEGQLEFLSSLPQADLGFSLAEAKDKLEEIIESLQEIQKRTDFDLVEESINDLISDLKDFLYQKNKKDQAEELKKSELSLRKQKLLSSFKEIENKINSLNSFLSEARSKGAEKTRFFQEGFLFLEQKRKELDQYEDQVIRIKLGQEKARLRQEDLKLRLEEAGFIWADFLEENQSSIKQREGLPWAESRKTELIGVEKKIIKLKQELSLIGEVDQEIVKEYEAVSGRYNFLSFQKQDLESALANLEQLCLSLDQKIASGFEEALKKIDKEFRRYFAIIFEGGKASLKAEKALAGDSQTIDLGIEISVSLPRKKNKFFRNAFRRRKVIDCDCLAFCRDKLRSPSIFSFRRD
jgi:chromosome segregation protein